MSRRNFSQEMKAAALRVLSENEILSSSHFGELLVNAGVVTIRKRNGKMGSRGAGFVGGAILSALKREGLISLWTDDYLKRARVTSAGERYLREHEARAQLSEKTDQSKVQA